MIAFLLAVSLQAAPAQPSTCGSQPGRALLVRLESIRDVSSLPSADGDCETGWAALRRFELTGDRVAAQLGMEKLLRAVRGKIPRATRWSSCEGKAAE